MKRPNWMTQASKDWTIRTMRQFIVMQNNYSFDGESPMRHSAEQLMKFACIEGARANQFLKVYNSLYPRQ